MQKKESKVKRDYSSMISKRVVYTFIALFLVILVIVDVYGVSLSNDIALRFLPTIFGLVFNFFIFIVFFDVREHLEWKRVKKYVNSIMGSELAILFSEILRLTENEIDDIGFKMSLSYTKDAKIRKDMIFSKLSELQKKEPLQLTSASFSLLRSEKDLLTSFLDIKRNLGEVQIRYERHLTSKITEKLIKLQDSLEAINMTYKTDIMWNKLQNQLPLLRELMKKLMPQMHDQNLPSIDLMQNVLPTCVKSLIQETYELWKMGIEFDLA